jgi:hypothetical protein
MRRSPANRKTLLASRTFAREAQMHSPEKLARDRASTLTVEIDEL